MVKIPIKTLCLILCFAEAAFLLAAQAIGSIVLIAPCLVCYLVLMVWAALQNMAMPVVLFFLPFAPLLKLMPDTISFFTLSLLVVYSICLVRGYRNVRIAHMVPALLLLVLTLTVKIAYGYSVGSSYFLFALSLMLVPFLVTELDGRYDFYWITLCFILGVLTAAFASLLLSDISSVARYVHIVTEVTTRRRSGFYNDPNFYAAHITAALSGVLVMLLNQVDRIKQIVLSVLAVLLIYCGLLSVSKSFMLIAVCILFCWFLSFLFRKGRISAKIVTIITLVIVLAYILSSSVFTDLLDLMFIRLSKNATMAQFTTHRVELWASYLNAFKEDFWLTLFGSGYSKVLVNDRAAHNTLLQLIFQFGLIGTGFMAAWYACFARTMLMHSEVRRPDFAQMAILFIGCCGPWMGLDYLWFDEIFLIPVYLCIAIRFLNQSTAAPSSASAVE